MFWYQHANLSLGESDYEDQGTCYFDDTPSIYTGYQLIVPSSNFADEMMESITNTASEAHIPSEEVDLVGNFRLSDSGAYAPQDRKVVGRIKIINCALIPTPTSHSTIGINLLINGFSNLPKPITGPFKIKIKPNSFGLRVLEDRIQTPCVDSYHDVILLPYQNFTLSVPLTIDLSEVDPNVSDQIPMVYFLIFLLRLGRP